MKVKVTEQGVLIPKEYLEGSEEVDILKEGGLLVVKLAAKSDPVLDFGEHPVSCGLSDASEHHDKYLCRPA